MADFGKNTPTDTNPNWLAGGNDSLNHGFGGISKALVTPAGLIALQQGASVIGGSGIVTYSTGSGVVIAATSTSSGSNSILAGTGITATPTAYGTIIASTIPGSVPITAGAGISDIYVPGQGHTISSTVNGSVPILAGSNVSVAYTPGISVTISSTGGGGSSPNRSTFSKTAYNVKTTDTYVAQVGAYIPGTDAGGATAVNLPPASSYPIGVPLFISDESGSIRPWYRLAITPNGSDVINRVALPLPLARPYQSVVLFSNGSNGWSASLQECSSYDTTPTGHATRGQVYLFHDLWTEMFTYGGQAFDAFGLNATSGGGGVYSSLSSGSHDGHEGNIRVGSGLGAGQYGTLTLGDSNYNARFYAGQSRYFECMAEITGFGVQITPTNNSIVRLGLLDVQYNSTPANAAFWLVNLSVSTTYLCIAVAAGGSTTVNVTSIPLPAVNTYHCFGVEMSDDFTKAYFFYDSTYAGTITMSNFNVYDIVVPGIQNIWVAGTETDPVVDYFRYHYIKLQGLLRPLD